MSANREVFNEQKISGNLDPLDANQADFNWKGLYERLGEEEPDSGEYARLTSAVGVIIRWLLEGRNWRNRNYARTVALRLTALAWTISPSYLDARSVAEIAKRIGVSPSALSKKCTDFRRAFSIANRVQMGQGWKFKKEQP